MKPSIRVFGQYAVRAEAVAHALAMLLDLELPDHLRVRLRLALGRPELVAQLGGESFAS